MFISALALMKGNYKNKVWKMALQIVASMKRDWMQTGRKPSGICGAALYISAISHGCSYSKSEIVKIVHICEATLTKRLIEFENTNSGSLTIEEFNQNAEEFEKENHSSTSPDMYLQESGKKEVLCQHKGKEPHFAHGLCRSCYKDFIELSGGLNGGCEPPAFQVAERDRLARASAEKERSTDQANQERCNHEKEAVRESASASAPQNLDKSCDDTFHKDDHIPSVTDETDNLSDIDDVEVNSYLNSEEESRYKKVIWEEMNKEYLEEQAAKEAAAAAILQDCGEVTDDVLAARKLAAAAAAAVAKSREQRKLKRAESRNAGPAPTAAEATRQMLTKKGLSSKINYDVLEKLFDESLPPSTKKPRMEPHHNDHNASGKYADKEDNEEEMNNSNKQEVNEDCIENDITTGVDEEQLDDQNEEEIFYYDEDDNDNFDED